MGLKYPIIGVTLPYNYLVGGVTIILKLSLTTEVSY